jgi:fatty acid CoA ligase FadD9
MIRFDNGTRQDRFVEETAARSAATIRPREYLDWLIEAGYAIERIPDYGAWLGRFEMAMRALPQQQRQYSLLPLLHNYQRPGKPIRGSIAPTDHFRFAVQEGKIGPDKDIPHITAPIIVKYITNLHLLGLL